MAPPFHAAMVICSAKHGVQRPFADAHAPPAQDHGLL